MPNYDYNVITSYTPKDNHTFINKVTFMIKDCSKFPSLSTLCNGYNFNRRPNDDAYCQPYILGDLIYFQISVDTTKYTLNNPAITINDSAGNSVNVASWTYGKDAQTNDAFITFIINTAETPFPDDITGCWYVKIALFNGSDYNDFIASEPFCEVGCNEDTLLIKGKYSNYDCEGNYYGEFDTSQENTFIPQFRIRGNIEPVGDTFEKTKNSKKIIKSKQIQNFLFRTEKLPYYVAKQIALCFNSELFIADGITYDAALKLDKDFEEGSEWIITETISIQCDEINFTCS